MFIRNLEGFEFISFLFFLIFVLKVEPDKHFSYYTTLKYFWKYRQGRRPCSVDASYLPTSPPSDCWTWKSSYLDLIEISFRFGVEIFLRSITIDKNGKRSPIVLFWYCKSHWSDHTVEKSWESESVITSSHHLLRSPQHMQPLSYQERPSVIIMDSNIPNINDTKILPTDLSLGKY